MNISFPINSINIKEFLNCSLKNINIPNLGMSFKKFKILTDLKKEAVKLPPSMAKSPNNFFWFAFLRIFSSMVFSLISLIEI